MDSIGLSKFRIHHYTGCAMITLVLFCQAQAELGEMKKEVESLRAEKEGVLKKLDTLESANERLIDMKVRDISDNPEV